METDVADIAEYSEAEIPIGQMTAGIGKCASRLRYGSLILTEKHLGYLV
jgi:hypothetical protein